MAHKRLYHVLMGGVILSAVFGIWWSVSALDLESTAPEANVAPGTTNVLVMDAFLPQVRQDTVLVGAGIGPQPDLRAGDLLYDIALGDRIFTDNKATPSKVWIDRDFSERYTGFHAAGTRVLAGHGDINMGLLPIAGVPGYSLSGPNDGNRRVGEHIYRDIGDAPGYIDASDQRVTSGALTIQNWFFDPNNKSGLIVLQTGAASGCPTGLALGDKVRVTSRVDRGYVEIVSISTDKQALYCALFVEIATPHPYAHTRGDLIARQSVNRDNNLVLVDDATGGVPRTITTKMRHTNGTLRGLAIGDTLTFADVQGEGTTLTFRITGISTAEGKIDVIKTAGNNLAALYFITNHQHANVAGALTDLLNPAGGYVRGVDRNRNGAINNDEPLYVDNDRNQITSADDERIFAISADTILLGQPADGEAGLLAETANTNPKWRRQSYGANPAAKTYAAGDDIVIDVDNSTLFSGDALNGIAVRNSGTATGGAGGDVSAVQLWVESNGQAGWQNTDQSLGHLDYQNDQWEGFGFNWLILGAPRIYVTADIAANAGANKTLQFRIPQNKLRLQSVSLPSIDLTNSFAQTIRVDQAPIITSAAHDQTQLTATSARFTYTTNENAQAQVTCNPGVKFGENVAFVNAGSITVSGLTSNTEYACQLTVNDAAGNTSFQNLARFTTLAQDLQAAQITSLSRIALAPTSARFQLSTDEVAAVLVVCNQGAVRHEESGGAPKFAFDVTVSGLAENTATTCTVTTSDGAGNVAEYGQAQFAQLAFTTPPLDNAPPQINVVAADTVITSTSVRYHFTTDEPASSAVTCIGAGFGVNITDNRMLNDITLTVEPLDPNTEYTCRIRVQDAVGNSRGYSQPLFITPLVLTIENGSISVAVTHQDASISWRTNGIARGSVRYGTAALNMSATESSDGTDHLVVLQNLQPTTRYFYKIVSQLGAQTVETAQAEFTTLAAPVIPRQLSVINSTVSGVPLSIPADGRSTATITAVVRDQNNAVFSGKFVVIRKRAVVVAGPGDIVAGGITDAAGQFTSAQQSSVAGSFEYSVEVDGQQLGIVTVSFTEIDRTPPAMPQIELPPELRDAIARGEAFTTPTPVTITGSKEAGSEVRLGNTVITPRDATMRWTYALNLQQGLNIFIFTAADAAGNASAPLIMTVNYQPQAGALQTPVVVSPPRTVNQIVTLDISCPAGSDQMMISEDPNFAGVAWQPYVQTQTLQMSAGVGNKQVYVRCRVSGNRNESPAFAVNVFLDAEAPPVGRAADATSPDDILARTNCLATNTCDWPLFDRLLGKIALDVEFHGEAFLCFRKAGAARTSGRCYYLGRPLHAWNVMRFLGNGISNRDMNRLFRSFATPQPGDLKVFEPNDRALANRFAGKIILQVEAHGEAYYIHPETLRGYYLGRPADAFRIMRELGLGINTQNIKKLPLHPRILEQGL